MTGLGWITQDDFAAGTLRSIGRGLDVGVGVWNAVNGLFDDDGDCYLRGNTREYSLNTSAEPLTFIWTGVLGTPIGLVSSTASLYRIDAGHLLTPIPGTPLARPVNPAIVHGELFLPNGVSWKGAGNNPVDNQLPAPLPGMVGDVHVCACAGRLVIGQGRFVRFSAANAPRTFDPTDYHELPEGTTVVGLAAIRDTLVIFTEYGIWTIRNLALDLTDDQGNLQHVLSKLIPELSLLHESGLSEWAGKIVAPCTDRCYLIDTISAPTPISDSIAPLYMQHIRAGRLPGGAKAYRNHYFLPWLNPDGTVASVIVCRLNRPVKGRFTYYPWSVLDGHAAQMVAGDISALDTVPEFLSAHRDGRVISYFNLFDPVRDVALDADGTTPAFDLETRDFPTGNGQPNHVRVLRVYYTLATLGGVQAELEAALSFGDVGQSYESLRGVGASYGDVKATYVSYSEALHGAGAAEAWPPGLWSSDFERYWLALPPRPADSPGIDPVRWTLDQTKRARYVRARFRCSDPVAKLIVHRLDVGVRPSTHAR